MKINVSNNPTFNLVLNANEYYILVVALANLTSEGIIANCSNNEKIPYFGALSETMYYDFLHKTNSSDSQDLYNKFNSEC